MTSQFYNITVWLVIVAFSGIIITQSILIHNLSTNCCTKYIENSTTEVIEIVTEPLKSRFRLISRKEWLAQPPNNPLENQTMPIDRVIIAHTASEVCETQDECTFKLRIIQTFHAESKNWDDIGYNFLIGGDGAAYEGRGWFKIGVHTKGYNNGSLAIAFIGTFTRKEPSEKQLMGAKLLINEGIKLGYLTQNYKLYPHRALFKTDSPGEALYRILKTWPHFTENL